MPKIIESNNRFKVVYRGVSSPWLDSMVDAVREAGLMRVKYGSLRATLPQEYYNIQDLRGIGEEWLLKNDGDIIAVFIDGALRCNSFYVSDNEWYQSRSLEVEEPTKAEAGFTLVEAVIGMALVCLTALGFAQIQVNSNLGQNFSDFRLSTNALASSLVGSVSNASSCTQGFQGSGFGSLTYVLPNRTISAGTALPGYKLMVTALNYVNTVLVQTNADGSQVYFGDLQLTTTPMLKVLGPSTDSVVIASVYLMTASGVVTNCSASAPTPVVTPSPSPAPSPIPSATPVVTPTPTPTPVVQTPVTNGPAVNDPCQH